MNISLRQVKADTSQAMFITSTGTVLFTSHVTRDSTLGCLSTTSITSVSMDDQVAEIGFIKWNESTGDLPYLCVGARLMELRILQDDYFSTVFLGCDGRIYRWKTADDMAILFADDVSLAPIAIAHDDTQRSSVIGDPDAESIVLYIQPTGFPLLRDIVATFVLFEQLVCERASNGRAMRSHARDITSSPLHGNFALSGDRRSKLTKDIRWTRTQHVPPARVHDRQDRAGSYALSPGRHRPPTRFTVDLTGQLFRRHKYPSAYGGYGDIWKCDWIKDARVVEVAVKVVRTNVTGGRKETEIKTICRELRVWVKLEHECVLPLYGISFDFGKFPAMVCPWLEGGTLSKYLECHEGLLLYDRLQLLGDIADGLRYLHGCGIVHGDLTGSNVLIKDNGKACLSDFGLSRIVMDVTGSSYLTSTVRGSVRWAAPELLEIDEEEHKEFAHVRLPSPQSDVYSFGSTMFQALTGKIPYHYYRNDAQVLIAVSRGMRPVRPNDPPVDDVYWKFMQQCWSSVRSTRPNLGTRPGRPSIEEIVDFLSVSKTRCLQSS